MPFALKPLDSPFILRQACPERVEGFSTNGLGVDDRCCGSVRGSASDENETPEAVGFTPRHLLVSTHTDGHYGNRLIVRDGGA